MQPDRHWRKAVRQWWNGRFVPYDNDPHSGLVFIGGTTEHHWTAAFARRLWAFWRAEWKWILGFMVAIGGLVIGLLRLS